MRMATVRGVASAGILALLPSLALAQGNTPTAPASNQPPPDTVVAIVDGQPLHRADVIESASNLPAPYQQQMEQIFPALIERLIDLKLLSSEARRRALQDDAAVKAQIAKFEEQAIREALLDRYLKEKMTDQAIGARYQEFVKGYAPQPEIRARHILLETEEQALAVIKELDGGADFAELAKTKSTDSAAAAKGGDLGYFVADQMVPEFAEAAFALKVGEHTKQPVKTRFGWHIIKVEDRRDKKAPTLEEARDQIATEMSQQLVGELLAQLRSKSQIERFNPDGSPIKEAPAQPAPPDQPSQSTQ